MPYKSFFTQGVCVLLTAQVSLDDLENRLGDFGIVGRHESAEKWVLGGPQIMLSYRPEVNGYVSVDIVDRQWPDHMGDPHSDSDLFSAWSMGHFGPFAYPGNLERAAQQAWHWPEGKDTPSRHQGFLRVRSSYVFGFSGNPPVQPSDYESTPELLFVTRVARALLELPQALCYFNPNGECLHTAEQMDKALGRIETSGWLPLDLWANIRLVSLAQHHPWFLMDTVGMWQLDIPDHEACFEQDRYDCNEVANFLRLASDYVLENGQIIKDGDTMDGAGGIRWQAHAFAEPAAPPPRQVLRWFPLDGTKPPEGLH